jgi:leucyl aminopeptidase
LIEVRLAGAARARAVLALAVQPGDAAGAAGARASAGPAVPVIADGLASELAVLLGEADNPGKAGAVQALPRPGRAPATVLAVGIGKGDESDYRNAGAALTRAAAKHAVVTVVLPAEADLRAFAEGAMLASYQFSLRSQPPQSAPKLRRILVEPYDERARPALEAQLAAAASVAEAVALARDLTNTPSAQKSPKWMADRIVAAAARRADVTAKVLEEDELRAAGFGGILAVGAGSTRPPRLVEISWRPRGVKRHVVLVGKGITFDSGGYSLKSRDGMLLMRKDMGGAAAVCAAVLAVADLALPVRVTAVVPLADNLVSGSAYRPGDVVRHYGGRTSEIQNTDAEGRVVLADALAYAAKRLRPDLLVDLATLTGASHTALGKRTGALLTDNDALAQALSAAGEAAGEPVWRLPLADDYLSMLASDVADLNNSPKPGAGVITAALYLREFTGDARPNWAHIDMSAPSWFAAQEGPLVKGATGWGVRLLVRWLSALAETTV